MKILHLNCQGLRNTLTIQYLKDIKKSSIPDILFLVETKVGYDVVDMLCKNLNYAHSFVLPANGLSGGLAIFWDEHVQLVFVNTPTLYHTDIYVMEGDKSFCLSYIYGNHVVVNRNKQWKTMIDQVDAGCYNHLPRLAIGDFNDIKYPYEKSGGAFRSDNSFIPFRNFVNKCGLSDVKSFGGQFTWVGKRYSHTVRSRIDRVMASCDWFDLYPSALVQVLSWNCSDHRALLLHTESQIWRRKKLF